MLVGWPQMNRWMVIRNAAYLTLGPGRSCNVGWRSSRLLAWPGSPGVILVFKWSVSRLEQVIQVRRLRRITVAAIEQAEVWAQAHHATYPDAFLACISLYSRSTDLETVSELAELPGTENFFRDKVAALLHLGMEVLQCSGDSTR